MKVTQIKQYKSHFEELWRNHKLLIIILLICFLFDTLTTIHFMRHSGIHGEIHPLVRYSALILGPITGTILSAFCFKAVASILLAMFLRPIRLWILILPSITSGFAGFYNLLG